MEGYLEKKEGFFGGFVTYFFILHEDTLLQLEKPGGKPVGSIHMRIAKILPSPDKKDKLQILIHNGTTEIILRARTIKEMVDWTNALLNAQRLCNEGRYDQFKPKVSGAGKINSPNKSDNSRGSINDPFSAQGIDRYSSASVNKPDFNASASVTGLTTNWVDRLNMRFFSKVFTQDSPLCQKMGQLCEIEAQL